MNNIIDWSKYGHGKKPEKPKWEVLYSANDTRDGIKITAVFAPEDLVEVVAAIKRQIHYWKDEPK